MRRIVFSDIDGTLVSSEHVVTPRTAEAIRAVVERGIPLVLDADGAVLHSRGFSPDVAAELIDFLEGERLPLTWCLYAGEDWLVRDRADPRVAREESIVRARSREGGPTSLAEGAVAHKVLCERFGVGRGEAVAFGDDYNDLGMLSAVGHPVVMANAPVDIRGRFEFVTADNDHDGIADALEQLFGWCGLLLA